MGQTHHKPADYHRTSNCTLLAAVAGIFSVIIYLLYNMPRYNNTAAQKKKRYNNTSPT